MDRHSVARFAQALDLAIYDLECEKQRRGIFFFDADVIINCVQGLTLQHAAQQSVRDPRLAVHALIFGQEFGKVRMLPLHLSEFDSKLRQWPKHSRSLSEDYRRALMGTLMNTWGLSRLEIQLREILQRWKTNKGQGWQDFAEFVRAEGFEVFVTLELCYGGDWQQRLQRAYRSNLFDFSSSSSDRFVSDDPLVHKFLEAFQGDSERVHTPYNNLVDAIALAGLAKGVSRSLGTHFRFYTETAALRRIFDKEVGSDWLAYESRGQFRTVLRTEDYFLMRGSFACLRYAGEARTDRDLELPREDSAPSLEELTDLSSELSSFLNGDKRMTDQILRRQVPFSGKTLGDTVKDFFDLKFLRSVVLNWNYSEDLPLLMPSFCEALGDEELTAKTKRDIERAIVQVGGDLHQSVGYLRTFRTRFYELHGKILKRRKDIQGGIPRIDTDVGLGRWSLHKRIVAREDIENLIGQVIDGTPSLLIGLAYRLAGNLLEVKSLSRREFEELYIFLWFIQALDSLVDMWEGAPEGRQNCDFSLEILYLVSRVKRERHHGRSAKVYSRLRSVVSTSEAIVDTHNNDREQSGIALMGLAHVCYWCQQVIVEGISKVSPKDGGSEHRSAEEVELATTMQELLSEWTEKSFQAGWKAAQMFEGGSLERAFAVNHCAYVGHIAGVHSNLTALCYDELVGMTGLHQHYRFADTLGLPHFLVAKRILDEHGVEALINEASLREKRERACENLTIAKNYLVGALPFFGDEEAEIHLKRVRYFCEILEC